VRTDNADFLRLGPDTSTTARNLLATTGDSTSVPRFTLENQDTSATTLHAENNQWLWSYGTADSASIYNWLLVGNRPPVAFTPLIAAEISGVPDYSPPGCTESRIAPQPWLTASAEEMIESLGTDVTRLSNGGSIVAYEVRRPYPSPSGGQVTVEFTIAPEHSDHVTVDVFDVAGRRVRSIVGQTLPRGWYRTTWDGRNANGRMVAAGTYFVRVQAGVFQKVEKVVVVR
jgi:hypothetical protein